MIQLKSINYNLGIPKLFREWKKIFSTKYLLADVFAGTTVAFVAIPLSLAIALASGVSPGVGLITSIIAGLLCAFFGGTPLAISGPAAAMSVLIADIVQKHGVDSLILICGIAGLMQLMSGILGLGKVARYVPLPVISGFTAGIGVIIIIGQLPRAFGLLPPPDSNIFTVLTHVKDYFHLINGGCVILVATTILLIHGLPKIFPKIPSVLPAVIISSLMAYFFHFINVPLIGAIPDTLPAPQLPQMTSISIKDLLASSLIIYLLASLETLLSSSAVDKMTGGKKHDSNQELIGQGIGNMSSSLFGGIPITGVIARSATNVKAGAKTRRSSIVHSIVILLAIFIAAPLIGAIPIAALAGVLFSVAFSMVSYKEFRSLWITARSEAIIYIITFFTIIFVDLLAGVQAGIAVACLIVLFRTTKTHLTISTDSHDDITRLSLVGALTFLSSGKMEDIQKQIATKNEGHTVLIDLSHIRNLDISGASAIIDLFNYCQSKKIHFYVKGLPRRFEAIFHVAGGTNLLDEYYIVSEHELRKRIMGATPKSSYGQLMHGVQRFYIQSKHDDKRLYEHISREQDPHTLFITCSDSRIVPSLITSSDPGELFIIRNIGNFIPPYQTDQQHSETAAIEFALNSFDINDIVICGHVNCGAIIACQSTHQQALPGVDKWISMIKSQLKITNNLVEMIQANIKNQVENLKQYPIVQEKMKTNHLKIHGWYFDFHDSTVFEWNEKEQKFTSILTAFENTTEIST